MLDPALRELYQEVILDHGRNPRRFGALDQPSHEADGHNPLCGDHVHICLKVDADGKIDDVMFNGKGCAISMASASIMAELILGKEVEEARALADAFYKLAKGQDVQTNAASEDMERLEVMSGVSQYPMRVKCATLGWHTFEAAMDDGEKKASTE